MDQITPTQTPIQSPPKPATPAPVRFTVNDMVKELNRMQEVESRLIAAHQEAMKSAEQLAETVKRLRHEADQIEIMIPKIDPFHKKTMAPSRRTATPKQEMAKEFYEKIRAGLRVNRPLVQQTYPEFNESDTSNFLFMLGNMANVKKVREGGYVVLYI